MSRFDEMFAASAGPVLADWFGDPIEYRSIDLAENAKGLLIELAIVGEEQKHRRRSGDGFELELVSVRTVSIICDRTADNFSGVVNPKQNARVVIKEKCEVKTYVVEEVLDGAGNYSDLKLKQISRVALGSREALGE